MPTHHRRRIAGPPPVLRGQRALQQWLVIIARHRPDLWTTWASLDDNPRIEVVVDRRQGQPWPGPGQRPARRGESGCGRGLRERGFAVIPRPDPTSAAR